MIIPVKCFTCVIIGDKYLYFKRARLREEDEEKHRS